LAGIALITAGAFYGGRASLQRSIKTNNTCSAWVIPRAGKIFSRGRKTEFSPVTPNPPAWNSTAYEGVNMDEQQQDSPRAWQMAKKEPNLRVDEVATPAPTYISLGDEIGTTTPTIWETETTVFSPENQTARYESYREANTTRYTGPQPANFQGERPEQAEGLGLLQDGVRPKIKRKQVSRASGHGTWTGSS